MKALLPKSSIVLAACLAAAVVAPAATPPQLPLGFEQLENSASPSFLARSRSGTVLLGAHGFTLSTPADSAPGTRRGGGFAGLPAAPVRGDTIRVEFIGALDTGVLSGAEQLPGKVNYLIGSDPSQWRTGLPLFEKVKVTGVYPGIDLVYYGNQRYVEYDFVVGPGADPSRIRLRITGADGLSLAANGDLLIARGATRLRQHAPVASQMVDGARRAVPASFVLEAGGQVRFELGDFDPALPLTIDPVLSYSSFLGGAGVETGWDIALGPQGSIYIVGDTTSADLPATSGAFSTNYSGSFLGPGGDAFVAKLNSAGNAYEFLTYLGGRGVDAALGIAVDSAGFAYITGVTSSTNFPTMNAISNRLSGKAEVIYGSYPYDAFVAKLNPSGSGLVYSTFLGGNGVDQGIGIAIDAAGQACVTGYTQSTNFPVVNALTNKLQGSDDAFVAKLNASGSAFVYSTFLGGAMVEHAGGIAADDLGAVYVTGFTGSTNFPVRNAYQTLLNRQANNTIVTDAFVTSLNPTGGLAWSTFLGGNNAEYGNRIAVDPARNAYVAGSAASTNFPVTISALQTGVRSNNFFPDAFVTKFTSSGTVAYSTTFGGASVEEAWDIFVDVAGNAFVGGMTSSLLFPITNAPASLSRTNGGAEDAFVSVLNSDGSAFLYSAYLGGAGDDIVYGIEADAAGNVYVTGKSYSTNLPVLNAFQPQLAGTADAFVAIIAADPVLQIILSGTNVTLRWSALSYGYILESAPLDTFDFAPVLIPPTTTNGCKEVTLPLTPPGALFRLRK